MRQAGRLWAVPLIGAAAAITVLAVVGQRAAGSVPGTVDLVAIDTDITGNDDATVGSIEGCVELEVGESREFDLVIKGVDPVHRIAGYQVDIDYDPEMIAVTGYIDVDAAGSVPPDNVTMISRINSTGGAGFFSLTDVTTVPGSMTLMGADGTGDAYAHIPGVQGPPFMSEPGSNVDGIDDDFNGMVDDAREASAGGVLARVTIEAIREGASPLAIAGPLGGADGFPDAIVVDGTEMHDNLLVRAVANGRVVVEDSCEEATPTPAPTPPPDATCAGRRATIVGTEGNDVLLGTSGDDVIAALGGRDNVISVGGDDLICAGAGDDRVWVGQGTVFLEDGADTVEVQNNSSAPTRLLGGPGDDSLYGADGNDIVLGGDGNDLIRGGLRGQNLLGGGPGDDVMSGGYNFDLCDGGEGSDTANWLCDVTSGIP